MLELTDSVVVDRIRADNSWWQPPHEIPADLNGLAPRAYLDVAWPLLASNEPRRAFVLLGMRRVGKTVLLHHAIARLIRAGTSPSAIHYLSLDTPSFTGTPLERLVRLASRASGSDETAAKYVFFDEIQYLSDWERHLKHLVDTQRSTKFVVSGSAAAALRLKSTESGAGRFSDFHLPPLTFAEYLEIRRETETVTATLAGNAGAISALNESFVRYLNFGGFPEVAASSRELDSRQFVRHDVIDKVLLRDLPSLYGIDDVVELNRLFNVLAYQTAQELSVDELSKKSGVSKNTIKKYLEYLRAAFLIDVVERIDRNGQRFKRSGTFKVYLTNPSMRAALFAPEPADGPAMGALVETGVLAQHDARRKSELHYARWDRGEDAEVDFVSLAPDGSLSGAVEVKWSDRYFENPGQLVGLRRLAARHPSLTQMFVTTRGSTGHQRTSFGALTFLPSAVFCYLLSKSAIQTQQQSVRELLQSLGADVERGD